MTTASPSISPSRADDVHLRPRLHPYPQILPDDHNPRSPWSWVLPGSSLCLDLRNEIHSRILRTRAQSENSQFSRTHCEDRTASKAGSRHCPAIREGLGEEHRETKIPRYISSKRGVPLYRPYAPKELGWPIGNYRFPWLLDAWVSQ